MRRAPWACIGALIVGLAISAPVAAQEPLAEDRPTIGCGPMVFRTDFEVEQQRQLIITSAYCAVLQRPPDEDGIAYWTESLADGLEPYELVQTLVASPERQARGTRSFAESLSALRLSPRRQAERELRRLAAEAKAEQDRLAERARMARAEEIRREAEARSATVEVDRLREEARKAEQRRIEREQQRQARLRLRTEISSADFDARIAQSGLGDVEFVTDALGYGRLNGDSQRVTVAYVHLSKTRGMRVSPGDRGRETVGTWASEIDAHVAINGNWFSPYDGPAVSNGSVYGGSDHFYTALFGFTAEGDAIIQHHREVNETVDDRVVEGVSGHPTLIYKGERTTDFGGDPTFTRRNPRTAIGLDQTGDVLILVTVDGRSSSAIGMTGDETAQLMERLGAHDAVMLDGGGSSTMWVTGRGIVNRPSGAPRAVGNQIAVYGD